MHAELRCTYRIQLRDTFGFRQVADLVPYLAGLGVSHVYLSPILKAAAASEHGYDGTDPTLVEPRYGGEAGLEHLFQELRLHGMGAVLDIVPNHVSATHDNPWWWDVLENGPDSKHAGKFDIDWQAVVEDGRPQVLLPVLGDDPRQVLARGEIKVEETASGRWVFSYFDATFPMNVEARTKMGNGVEDIAELLSVQHYQLAEWQTGTRKINYRRFFDVPTLIGLRVEDPDVFDATHRKVLDIVAQGPVDGLRIDHPDGLREPAAYFARLRDAVPGLWLIAEKILSPGESLPETWPIHGTTGYDFMNRAGALFVDPGCERQFTTDYEQFTGDARALETIVREQKRRIVSELFTSECRRLSSLFSQIAASKSMDCQLDQATHLLTDCLAAFPVYRNYVMPGEPVSEADRSHAERAFDGVRLSGSNGALAALLEDLLLGRASEPGEAEFLARFQQLTGPVMAKGVEDTSFYQYVRMIALNEVGGDPAAFGTTTERFHAEMAEIHQRWPLSMLATSTHDTKRSEDVRTRLFALPGSGTDWHGHIANWSAAHRSQWGNVPPDPHAEQMFYQTWIGAWPIKVDRMEAFMQKACREAKLRTSWIHTNEGYEEAMLRYIRWAMSDPETAESVGSFASSLMKRGNVNSLALTLLKLTCPGVPDIYQGCELWNYHLVDPDNRSPVDFGRRQRLMDALDRMPIEEIMRSESSGLPKIHLIRETLALRKERPEYFGPGRAGGYQALLPSGGKANHLLAFRRGEGVAVVVPRLVPAREWDWCETSLDFGGGKWRNRMDGRIFPSRASASDLFREFPVALMERVALNDE